MDFYDSQLSSESSTGKNDIFLDDIPVDIILYKDAAACRPTPADIAMLWAEGYPLSEPAKKAIIAILINKISIAFNLNRLKEAESILKKELENAKSNPAECIRLLIALVMLYEKIDPDEAKKYYNKVKKQISGHEDLLDNKTRNNWRLLSKCGNFEVNPHLLRSKALDMLEKKQYTEAEKIYRQMIELGFELPGTLCHLARVQLLSGQEKEAEKSVRKAWDQRSKALKYVVPRIIFFKILFLMIRNRDYSLWVSKMGKELQNPDSLMEWLINPLLESFKSRLSPENHQVLVTLAESLQNKDPKSLRGFLFS
jgi:tetratricopeptide (TPR) repeat protein